MPRFNWAEIEFGGEIVTAVRDATLPLRPRHSKIEISSPSHAPQLIADAEDPRFFVYRNKLYCYYTLPFESRKGVVYRIQLAELDSALRVVATHTIDHGHDRERNWGFFARGDVLYALYDPDSFKVLRFSNFEVVKEYMTLGIRWSHGRACGSTPPIEHDGRLSMFFHSRRQEIMWRGRPGGAPCRTYYIGYCEFEPEPPFKLIRYSVRPLPIQEAKRHKIIFPCSALRDGDGWRLACGFDDKHSGAVHVPDAAIEQSIGRGVAQLG